MEESVTYVNIIMKCNDCGIEGIHACLGKPMLQEDLPEGFVFLPNDDVDALIAYRTSIESACGISIAHCGTHDISESDAKKDSGYCKKCGGLVDYDKSSMLMSYPAKYKGRCRDCSEIYYTVCSEVN